MKKTVFNFVPLCLCAFLLGCAVMAPFDQNSYRSAHECKELSLGIVGKATEPAAAHLAEIGWLETKLSAQLAYEQGKGKKNLFSAKQWEILVSPDHALLGGLLKEWKAGKTFSAEFLNEKKIQIGTAFDEILRLEGAKKGGEK